MVRTPLKVFIIYARKDEELKDEFLSHLIPFERKGILKVWNDREIKPGEKWETVIMRNLSEADIILPLVSANFFASNFIDGVEMREAITRHHKDEILIIPVIVKPCAWNEDSLFKVLQVLPKDGKPVDSAYWHSHDEAWETVVRSIQSRIPVWYNKRNLEPSVKPDAEKTIPNNQTRKGPVSKKKSSLVNPNPQSIIPSEGMSADVEGPSKVSDFDIGPASDLANTESGNNKVDEEQMWADAIKQQDINLVNEYLDVFPEGKYKRIALPIVEKNIFEKSKKIANEVERERLLFNNVEKEKSLEICESYLTAYPDGVHKNAVLKIRKYIIENNKLKELEELLYNEAIRTSSIKACQEYLDEFNNGKYVENIKKIYEENLQEIEIHEWDKVLEQNHLRKYIDFIIEYEFRHKKYLGPRLNNEILSTANLIVEQKIENIRVMLENLSGTLKRDITMQWHWVNMLNSISFAMLILTLCFCYSLWFTMWIILILPLGLFLFSGILVFTDHIYGLSWYGIELVIRNADDRVLLNYASKYFLSKSLLKWWWLFIFLIIPFCFIKTCTAVWAIIPIMIGVNIVLWRETQKMVKEI